MSRGELLPLHHVAKGYDVDGVEGTTWSNSDNVFPPILVVFISVSCVSCFYAAPSQNHRGGGGIYSRFYVRPSPWSPRLRQNDARGLRWALPCGQECVLHGGPSFGPLESSLTSSSPALVFPKKMTWKKVWVCLMSERSLKVKNMKKQGNLLHSVKNQMKGGC
jgi:hypothetical protein